jgi:hypothetical protein
MESRTDRLYMQALMLQVIRCALAKFRTVVFGFAGRLPLTVACLPTHVQEKKKAKAAELDRECTFAPKLVAQSRPTSAAGEGTSSGKADRFSRLYAQAEATRAKLNAKRDQIDPEVTFKPVLSAKSPIAPSRQSAQVFDQLYAKVC